MECNSKKIGVSYVWREYLPAHRSTIYTIVYIWNNGTYIFGCHVNAFYMISAHMIFDISLVFVACSRTNVIHIQNESERKRNSSKKTVNDRKKSSI